MAGDELFTIARNPSWYAADLKLALLRSGVKELLTRLPYRCAAGVKQKHRLELKFLSTFARTRSILILESLKYGGLT
jgi:hypothetical protein